MKWNYSLDIFSPQSPPENKAQEKSSTPTQQMKIYYQDEAGGKYPLHLIIQRVIFPPYMPPMRRDIKKKKKDNFMHKGYLNGFNTELFWHILWQ